MPGSGRRIGHNDFNLPALTSRSSFQYAPDKDSRNGLSLLVNPSVRVSVKYAVGSPHVAGCAI